MGKLWVAIAAVLGYMFVKDKADAVINNIETKFKNVKWEGFTQGRSNFSITYSITNRNPDVLKIFGFRGLLTWRNTPFADIGTTYTEANPLVLTTNEGKSFTSYFSLPLIDVAADLMKLLWGQRPLEGATYEGMFIKGTLTASMKGIKGNIPIEEPIVLTI